MDRIGTFLKELRRRRVFRVAALYIIGAWVVLQVADLAFPGLGIPDWAIRYVWIGAFLGFPIALIFGWRFDIIGGHLVHTPDSEAGEPDLSLRRTDYLILAGLAVVVSAITFGLVQEIKEVQAPGFTSVDIEVVDPNSIAVLPFANRSAVEADAYFVDGIHDDILTQLARIRSLKVISRTSVERFRDTKQSLQEIGAMLGARHIIEGGVQRAADRVRINAQLIDAHTDLHLWAQTYDRELTTANLFAIQSEIATAIVDALRAVITPEEQDRLEAVPTQSMAALEAYFRGKQQLARRTVRSVTDAAAHFQQAIELDPGFVLAHVGLADSYLLQHEYANVPSAEVLEKAQTAIDRALQLDSAAAEAYASLGDLKGRQRDHEAAELGYQRAIALNPNYPTAHHWYAVHLRKLGRLEQALAESHKAVQLDPLSPIINVLRGNVLGDVGRWDEAERQYEKVIELDPAVPAPYRALAIQHWQTGRYDQAVARLREAVARDAHSSALASYLNLVYQDLGDADAARHWVGRALKLRPDGFWPNATMSHLQLYLGNSDEAMRYAQRTLGIAPRTEVVNDVLRCLGTGELEAERARLEQNLLEKEKANNVSAVGVRAAISLAAVMAQIGEKQQANVLLEKALSYLSNLRRLGSFGYGIADAHIHALRGEKQLALSALREAIDAGWRMEWWITARCDPYLDAIRDEPEFQAMMEEIRLDMAAQLARVREMEANGELAPIPE